MVKVQQAQRQFLGREVASPPSQLGQQVADISSLAVGFLQQKQNQNDASFVGEKTSELDLQSFQVFEDWKREFSSNPTGGVDVLKNNLTKLSKDVFRGAPSNRSKQMSSEITNTLLNTYQKKAAQWSSKQVIENVALKTEKTADNLYTNSFRQADPNSLPSLFKQIDVSLAANAWLLDKNALIKQDETMRRGVVVNMFEGILSNKEAFKAEELLDSGVYDGILKSDDIKQLNTKIDKQIAQIDNERKRVEKEQVKEDASLAQIQRVKTKLETGAGVFDPHNKKDKAAVNVTFEAAGLNDAIAKGDPIAANEFSRIVRDTGIIPTSAESFINSSMLTGNNQQIFFAADLVKRIEEEQPLALGQLNKQMVAKADMVNKFKATGLSDARVMDLVNTQFDPQETEVISQRKKELTTLLSNDQARDELTDLFDSFLPFDEPDLQAAPRAANRSISDYKQAFEAFYMLTGDKEIAEKQAKETVQLSYGLSKVAGRKEVMKFPPESFYGVEGSNNKWMVKQAKKDIIDNLTFEPSDREDPEFTLLSDNITARQIGAGVSPSYLVLVKRKDGSFDTLKNPDTHQVRRMVFDNTKEKERMRVKQEEEFKERVTAIKNESKRHKIRSDIEEEIGYDELSLTGQTSFTPSAAEDIQGIMRSVGKGIRKGGKATTQRAKDLREENKEVIEMLEDIL